jgi:hypothetical protein
VVKNHCLGLTGLGKLTLQSSSADFSSWVISVLESCDTFKNLLPGLNCFRICIFKTIKASSARVAKIATEKLQISILTTHFSIQTLNRFFILLSIFYKYDFFNL